MNRRFGPNDKVALLIHGQLASGFGKLGHGMLRYSDANIVAIIDDESAGCKSEAITGISRGVPIVATVAEAAKLGAQILVIGIAPAGGQLPMEWWPQIHDALRCGMSLVNPLHGVWAEREDLKPLVQNGCWIWDVRKEPDNLQPGTGRAAQLRTPRILTVGSDMSVGKMTAGLELLASARKRGLDAAFVASGQVGICITGSGVALDAVRLDYATGAVEAAVLDCADSDLVVIEGQGSLSHPASTATLALMRGAMPTHLLFVSRAKQTTLSRMPEFAVPPLPDLIRLNEDVAAACGAFIRPKVFAVALNTADVSDEEAQIEIDEVQSLTGLPTTDPVRRTADKLLAPLLESIEGKS